MQYRYTIVKSIDNNWGSKDEVTQEWNGMVGMVVRKVRNMFSMDT